MKLETALKGYEGALREGNMHIYPVNSCYDRCAHCYMSAVPEHSSKAKYIDKGNLLHFVDLLREDRPKGIHIGLSGGDPLLYPDIVEMLDVLSEHSRLEVLTSGFALSSRNTKNRKKLLEALGRSNASFLVASPEEPYHSITWDDISEIRQYVKEQGFNPNKLGYPSRAGNIANKVLLASTIIGGAVMTIGYLLEKCSDNNGMPQAIPIGRAKKLPEEQQKFGTRDCTIFEKPGEIYVNYDGNLQYCIYTCHDGFMNIGELAEIDEKEEAIQLVLKRLAQNVTFQDMIEHERCYFSKKIRKK